jgi:hypothetical protein
MTTQRGIEAYPLCWPQGQQRAARQVLSNFDTGFVKCRELLFAELRRMGASGVIVSTNIPLMRDGQPRANYAPNDTGVAVYFKRKNKDFVFACDKYRVLKDNMLAIAKTIEALRGIERWGAGEMMERAFTGFLRLPDKAIEVWRAVLEFAPEQAVSLDLVEARFKSLIRTYHEHGTAPDREKYERVVEARNQARKELAA